MSGKASNLFNLREIYYFTLQDFELYIPSVLIPIVGVGEIIMEAYMSLVKKVYVLTLVVFLGFAGVAACSQDNGAESNLSGTGIVVAESDQDPIDEHGAISEQTDSAENDEIQEPSETDESMAQSEDENDQDGDVLKADEDDNGLKEYEQDK